jgi:hypothetical protein
MVGYAQLIKAVAPADARLEIVNAENIQAGFAAGCGKQLPNGLYALACLAPDFNRDINAHRVTSACDTRCPTARLYFSSL